MAITASGLFGLSLEKCLINTAAIDWESVSNKTFMVTDTAAPDFDLHDFYADLSAAEVSGTGYTAGGRVWTSDTPAWTLSGGTATFDKADDTWTTSTITDAMAAIGHADPVASDPVMYLQDFGTAASTTAGTFTVQHNASGIVTIDYTP